MNTNIPSQDHEQTERLIRYINLFSLALIVVYFFYVGYGFFIGSNFVVILATFFVALVFLALYFNISGNHLRGKALIFLLTSGSVAITYHICTLNWAILTSYVPIFLAYAFFFQFPQEKRAFRVTGVFLLMTIISCFTVPRYILWKIELTEEVAYMSDIIHLIISSLVGIVVLFLVIRNKVLVNRR